jgi:flavin reductase (DIM6/NTAB) family NADH-FMN oxidoreductase RutF
MKTSIPIKPFWYSDILVLPKLVTIITTVNEQGVVNAAPYSLFLPYDVLGRRPQVMVGMRRFSHTYKNIVATGEFVVNLPSADFLGDVMETSRSFREGVDELVHTRFTPIASQGVAPPTLRECGQHIECRLHETYEVDRTQIRVVGDIVAIVVDEELVSIDRGKRIERLNLPIYMGDEKRKYFYYGKVSAAEMFELKPPPKEEHGEIKTKLQWEEKALCVLREIPSFVQPMVVETVEDIVRGEGKNAVSHSRFMQMLKEYAPEDVLERFVDE